MALGARTSQVGRMVLQHGAGLSLIGITIGLFGAFAATRALGTLLYEIGHTDLTTYVVVSVLFLGVALIASLIPAVRAARTDVLNAIKYE